MSTSSNIYKERKVDTLTLLDLISESMFKMSFLMRHVTIALEQKNTEDVYFLSRKGLELLAILESMLQQNETTQESLGDFIKFCETMSTCLEKVSLDESGELAKQLVETFKTIGVQFQEKQRMLEASALEEDDG